MCSFRMMDESRHMSSLTQYLAAPLIVTLQADKNPKEGWRGPANLSLLCLSNETKVGGEYKQP